MLSRHVARYGLALLTTTTALGVTLGIWPLIRPSVSPVFLLAVMLTAWRGGLGPGLAATALASVFSAYFFMDPRYSLWVGTDDIARWIVFTAVALAISSLTSARKRAEEQLTRSLADKDALLQERELLLKEIHHRVKNNLQVVSSLLLLQSSASDDPALQESCTALQHRIRAMALVHQALYQSRDLARLNVAEYLRLLIRQLFDAYNIQPDAVRLQLEVDDLPLSLDRAIPCGLILNELVANALKYAFPSGTSGELMVSVRREGRHACRLMVQDPGIGPPDSFMSERSGSMGLRLVHGFAEQLSGSMRLERDQGTAFVVSFPIEPGAVVAREATVGAA